MSGALWIVPDERVPKGAWLLGTGCVLLGLNVLRYLRQLEISRFTAMLGMLAVAGGVSDLLGVRLPLVALCLLALARLPTARGCRSSRDALQVPMHNSFFQ